jgi:hypothetical protein
MLAFSSQDPIAHEAALHLSSEQHHQILAEKPLGQFINARLEQAIEKFSREPAEERFWALIPALLKKAEFTTLAMFPYTRVHVPVIPLKCAESIKTRREQWGCPEVCDTKSPTSMQGQKWHLSRTGITKVTLADPGV